MTSFHISPRWGQHFLVDKAVRDIIIDKADLKKEDTVVEVGVGKGILTEVLVQKAERDVSNAAGLLQQLEAQAKA